MAWLNEGEVERLERSIKAFNKAYDDLLSTVPEGLTYDEYKAQYERCELDEDEMVRNVFDKEGALQDALAEIRIIVALLARKPLMTILKGRLPKLSYGLRAPLIQAELLEAPNEDAAVSSMAL